MQSHVTKEIESNVVVVEQENQSKNIVTTIKADGNPIGPGKPNPTDDERISVKKKISIKNRENWYLFKQKMKSVSVNDVIKKPEFLGPPLLAPSSDQLHGTILSYYHQNYIQLPIFITLRPLEEGALGIRHVQCVMLFFAMLLGFAMRVNMSLAIVAMTDGSENSFDWSIQIQSIILSSFFWGYVILQVPGGLLADRLGGNVLITISIGVNSVISLLLPTAAYYGSWQAVCACRVLQGLTQGFIFPCTHNLIGKWVPLEEKSRLSTIIYAGAQLGTAAMLMSAGFLADYWGWSSIFYSIGSLGVAWTVIYLLVGAGSPQASKMISEQEKLYIQNSLGHVGGHKTFATPWKALFTSVPFLSLIIVHCGHHWGFWTLMTEIPSFMSQVLGVDIKANGVLSALPYIAMYILSFPFGFLSDYILAKKWLSTTATRKISNSIGHWGPALFLIGLGFVPPGNISLAVGLLTMVVGLNAGHFTGFQLVHLDMSPNFAGTMLGITNGIANLMSIIAPLTAGAIIQDETDSGEWMKVFYLSSSIYFVCNLIFLIFGTSVKQPWNEPTTKDSVENATDPSSNKTTEKIHNS